jgi:chlorobactene glucosyltransferase
MELFLVSAAWLIYVLYSLSSIGKNYFERVVMIKTETSATLKIPFVTIIIPARNEEANIERCLNSFLKQSYPRSQFEIIVVDDNSTDNTAPIVRSMMGDHPELLMIGAEKLPAGWTGKNHACWTGANNARGEWYCFVDADVVSEPQLLETAMHFADSRQLGLLSINPFQELVSISERCLLPGIFFAIAASMNFKNANDPARPEAIANGQFMLFKRSVYESIGGHKAVRSEIMEDIALARLLKRSDYPVCWVFGDDMIRTRMYQSFSNIREGFSKNIADIMNIKSFGASIYICLKSLLLGWMPLILPLWACIHISLSDKNIFSFWGFGLAMAGSAIMFICALSTIRFLKIPLRYFLAFVLGLTMHFALTIDCLWKRKRGKRIWKGRTYTQA